jgi:hypothetical protein
VQVLAGGAVLYALACTPAIVGYDYLDVDPALQVLPFVAWPIPVVVSAWFEASPRVRWPAVALYGIWASFALTAAGPLPFRHMACWALLGLAGVALVEALAQCAMGLVRTFPAVEADGITGNSPALWLPPVAAALLLLSAAAVGSLAHRSRVLADSSALGRADAKAAWAGGQPALYVTVEEYHRLQEGGWDIARGLWLRLGTTRAPVVDKHYRHARNTATEALLRDHGPPPVRAHLFTRAEMRSLFTEGRLAVPDAFPVVQGRTALHADGRVVTATSTSWVAQPPAFIHAAVVAEKEGSLVVADEGEVRTFSPTGDRLQVFSYQELGLSETDLNACEYGLRPIPPST